MFHLELLGVNKTCVLNITSIGCGSKLKVPFGGGFPPFFVVHFKVLVVCSLGYPGFVPWPIPSTKNSIASQGPLAECKIF